MSLSALSSRALRPSPRCRYQEEKRNEDRRQMQVFRDWQVGAVPGDYFSAKGVSHHVVLAVERFVGGFVPWLVCKTRRYRWIYGERVAHHCYKMAESVTGSPQTFTDTNR